MKKIIATTKTKAITSQAESHVESVEKKMIEWHDMLFENQLNAVNRMNPITSFVTGMMAACGEISSQIAGLTANRLVGDITAYEFITKITKICCNSEEEYETLEGLVKLFQGLIDTCACDSKITSTKEELEVVLNNI